MNVEFDMVRARFALVYDSAGGNQLIIEQDGKRLMIPVGDIDIDFNAADNVQRVKFAHVMHRE